MVSSQDNAAESNLPLRMRKDLLIRPQHFDGERYWGVKDPVSLRYYHLRDEEYHVLQMLDGRISRDEILRGFDQRFAPRKLTHAQLQNFLGMLHREGMLLSDAPDQGDELLARGDRLRRQAWLQAISNPLAIRFRGFDPERLLRWMYPRCRWLFSRVSLLASAALIAGALLLVAVGFGSVVNKLPDFHAFFTLGNAFWLAVAVALTKVLHELGHALTCKHFGGECHEMGLMLLVFTPCLYCNVSDSWMLPNKWHRAAIGAAGMYVEAVLASICTFLWHFSEPGLFNTLCLNLMFVCSVNTLLFNGNPLLRYDGYFILADILEVPNLARQSGMIVSKAVAWHLLGIKIHEGRLLPQRRRALLGSYAVASLCYRWFVAIAILWFINEVLKPHRLEALTRIMAVVVFSGLILVPSWKGLRLILQPGRNRKVKWTRFIVRGGLAAAAIAACLMIPLPYRVTAPALIEAQGAASVYVPVPGTLLDSVRVGDTVRKGQTLATLDNSDVALEVAKLRGERNQQKLHLANLVRRRAADSKAGSLIPAAREALADIEERLRQRVVDQQRLRLVSPADGIVLPPRPQTAPAVAGELVSWTGTPLDERNRGAYLDTGSLFCLIGDPTRTEAILIVDQIDVEFVQVGQTARIQLDQWPSAILSGTITEVAEVDLKVTPRELIAHEDLPTRADAAGVERPLNASYQARVQLSEHDARLLIDAQGRGKIDAGAMTLGRRLYRFLARTFRLELS